ncbi:major facilitator superfamily domain-containing protein 6-like protein B [Anneissia japonica]|uniref:major facilitator superfamily domain-containing protein 6-like protein B n=1 Tax=Anneissia japonica TaxID=1529436 RepID=UPI0014258E26|nr:major facilitator superfamily domain-containing protein 6-like protein B [Anneissia japonica]
MVRGEQVNLKKVILFTTFFFTIYYSGKGCLLPYLTLYFRQLGLSATQTGMLFGGKALVGFWTGPAWARCARRYKKRRIILMISLFMAIAGNLGLTLIPPVDKALSLVYCPNDNHTDGVHKGGGNGHTNITHTSTNPSLVQSTPSPEKVTEPNVRLTSPTFGSFSNEATATSEHSVFANALQKSYDRYKKKQNAKGKEVSMEKFLDWLKSHDADLYSAVLAHTLPPDFGDRQKREDSASDDADTSINSGTTRWSLKGLQNQMFTLKDQFMDLEYRTFIFALSVILIGELFASPGQEICEDALYETLDSVDEVEKYGSHRSYGLFGYGFFAFITSIIVDNASCIIFPDTSRLMIYFYSFAIFFGLAFLLAFCYPIYTDSKVRNRSKYVKGLKAILSSRSNAMFVITMIFAGAFQANITNFLFWLLQDLGGSELLFGSVVFISTICEIPLLYLGIFLAKKISNIGTVALAMFFLSVRCLLYSFLQHPWAVLPIELSHAFSYGALMGAVSSLAEQIAPPGEERSVEHIFMSLYWGFGYGCGCMIGGYLYDKVGLVILFQGSAVLAFIWATIVIATAKLVPQKKKTLHYASLLQGGDEDDISDDSDEMFSDDWLVNALNEK